MQFWRISANCIWCWKAPGVTADLRRVCPSWRLSLLSDNWAGAYLARWDAIHQARNSCGQWLPTFSDQERKGVNT